MIEYRIRATGAVLSLQGVRELYPNCFVPTNASKAYLDHLGVDGVVETPPPSITTYQSVTRNGVEFDGTDWKYAWTVRNWTTAEKDAYDAVQVDRARLTEIDTTIKAQALLKTLKAMTREEFSTWWSQRTTAQKLELFEWIAFLTIHRVL